MKKLWFWLPRILAILFIIFISLFALDVFTEGYSFWQTIGAFLIHLMPSFILIILTLISWRRPITGGLLFLILAIVCLSMIIRKSLGYLILSGPSFLIAILFLLQNKLSKNKEKKVNFSTQ